MSQENVEIVKEFTRLYEAAIATSHVTTSTQMWSGTRIRAGCPSAGIYHGHEGVEQFFRQWLRNL